MELYIIRHGDPDYANDTLTEKGWDQAKLLAKRMEQINPQKIYSSPMGRAKDTATPTCELLGMEYAIENWTAESMDYMQHPTPVRHKPPKSSWNSSLINGVEDFKDYAEIDRSFTLDELPLCSDDFLAKHGYIRRGLAYRTKKPNNDRIAIFCHGGFGGAWIAHLLSLPPAMGWMHFTLATTSVTKFLFDNSDNGLTYPRLIYINDRKHLK